MLFNHGDRVEWTYWHYLNSRSRIQITKTGVFRHVVKHRADYLGNQKAVVQFDGNKRPSTVPLASLRPTAV